MKYKPTLRSLGQFLLTKIILLRLFDCNWHLFKFVTIPINEKFLLVSIKEPTMLRTCRARNATIENRDSYFAHHFTGHLMSLTSIWNLLNISNSLFTTSFVSSLVPTYISKMSKLLSSSICIFATCPNFAIGWRMW